MPWGIVISAGISAASEGQKAGAARDAAGAQERQAQAGIAEQRRQFDITQEQAEPFRQAGLSALGQQQALLGLSGQPAQQQAMDAFQESPGQAFLRQRGEQATLRNASAIGGLGGGEVRSELQRQGIGFAQQDLQNQLQRLGGIAGQGQVATSNVAQLGAQTSGNISNLLGNVGQAQAGGILGAGAAGSKFLGQVGGGLLAGNLTGGFGGQPAINQQTGQLIVVG